MLNFHEPEPDVLQAVGRIALRHSQLDHMLKLTIKSLSGITVQQALHATAFEGSTVLRERIRKLARKTLG